MFRRGIEAGDFVAFFIVAGIAARRHDDADGLLFFPADQIFGKRAVDTGFERGNNVAFPASQHGLRFGIAEAAVEFDHARLAVMNHQPGVEHAFVGDAALFQLGQRAAIDFFADDFQHGVGGDRRGRVGAHAAGVRAEVSVEHALVILRRSEHHNMFAVDQRENGGFFADQKIFDHDAAAGVAERSAERVFDGLFGLFDRFGDGYPFTGGEAVGFDHNRRAALTDVSAGFFGVGENGAGGGRNSGDLHNFLGEFFTAFEFGGGFARTENAEARSFQRVGQTGAERRFGADHGQVRFVGFGPADDSGDIGGGKGEVRAELGGTGVTRRAEKLRLARIVF